MSGLRHATLAEQAYEELGMRIMSGRLPAGHRLLAEELATQLAISPTPVKEALAELERDGLVQAESRRASTVRRFSRADIAEIYDARILIETHLIAAGLRARRLCGECVAALRRLYAVQMALGARLIPADLPETIRLDREFHETIVGRGGNSVLVGWHRVLLRQTQTIRSYSLDHYDMARARDEHGAILSALQSGKVAPAVRALRLHLEASRDEMLSRPADDLPPRP